MTDFRSFEIVDAIARNGSLSRAAEALNMSQPALTKALSALEADIGFKLLTRRALGMEPTPFADVFLRRWDSLHSDLIEMRREIDQIRSIDDGILRVATGYLAATSAESALGMMTRKFPGLRIATQQLVWSDVAAVVRRGEVDIGIADPADAEQDPLLDVEFLSERAAHFVCRQNHPILKQDAPTLADILPYPMALNRIPNRLASQLCTNADDAERFGFLRTGNGHLRPPIEVQSVSAIQNILTFSDAISILPDDLMETPNLARYLAKIERFRPPWLKVRLGFITRRQSVRPPVMQAFIDDVRLIEIGGQDQSARPRLPEEAKSVT